MKHELLVSERFGPTIQGEGPAAGRPAYFVRLGLCNLDCIWCDTPYTWDFKGRLGVVYDRHSFDSVDPFTLAQQVKDAARPEMLVVITGGEPLVQRAQLVEFVAALVDNEFPVHVETNGTLDPGYNLSRDVVTWVVSPKLAHARTTRQSIDYDVLRRFVELDAHFKFVIADPGDIDEVHELRDAVDIPVDRVWLMPEGIVYSQAAHRCVAEQAAATGYNMSTRLHVLAWGNERGR